MKQPLDLRVYLVMDRPLCEGRDLSHVVRDSVSGGVTMVHMVVRGVPKFNVLQQFKSFLENQVRGVKAVHQRNMEKGTANLDLDLEGNASTLAAELSEKRFNKQAIDVTKVSADSLEVELGK